MALFRPFLRRRHPGSVLTVVIPTRPVGPAAVRWRLAAVEPAVGVVHPAVDVAPVIAITVAVEVTEAAAVGVAVRAVLAPLPVVRVVAVVARVACQMVYGGPVEGR